MIKRSRTKFPKFENYDGTGQIHGWTRLKTLRKHRGTSDLRKRRIDSRLPRVPRNT